jgi:hypothetical protein
MADWPTYDLIGENNTGTTGTNIPTASGSAHTKGAWTELVAATSFDVAGLWVDFNGTDSVRPYLVDIGMDSGGGDTVVIPNVYWVPTVGTIDRGPVGAFFPVSIASGAQIVARAQCNNSTQRNVNVCVRLVSTADQHPLNLSTAWQAYGVNTATTAPTVVDPGAVADTLAWTQITASTSNRIRRIGVSVQSSAANVTLTDARWRLHIGTGAAASEVIVVEGIAVGTATASDFVNPSFVGPFEVDIAAGTRLAIGARCNITDATDRLLDVVVYGCEEGGSVVGGASSGGQRVIGG